MSSQQALLDSMPIFLTPILFIIILSLSIIAYIKLEDKDYSLLKRLLFSFGIGAFIFINIRLFIL